ncbi:MAG: DUF3598 family protein, partial [Microcystis sp.]
ETQDLGQEAKPADFAASQFIYPYANKRRLGKIENARVPREYFRTFRDAIEGAVIYDSQSPERPMLTVEQLLGQWRGQAVTTGRDFYNSAAYSTHVSIERQGDNYLSQTLTFGDNQITSSARIEGQRLLFENSPLPMQILLLPDGASCNTPLKITAGHPFVLEVGWLLSPTQRQRLIRSYDQKGEWTGITLVTEEKENY